jgi:hypothetical protein
MMMNADQLDVQRVWDDAVRVLDQVGLEIGGEVLTRAVEGVFPIENGRVRIGPDVATRYADEIRSRFGGPTDVEPVSAPRLYNLPLNPYWLDPADGQINPNDLDTVVRNTKLIYQVASEADGLVGPSVAGVPQDVPAEIQFLMVYATECIYAPHPGAWGLMHSRRSMELIFEAADIMGAGKMVCAEPISPLRFGGQSVDLAIEAGREDVPVTVDCMPVLGVTAPADWHMAWAQSVAENLGAYILLRACGVERVGPPSFRLFLPNPSAMTPYFSAPQHVAVLCMRREVRALFGLPTDGGEVMLVASKAADAQAAMEKAAGCALAKAHGFKHLEGAGMLWMDEVFSPQQLMIDVEIARYVSAADVAIAAPKGDVVASVREGLDAGSFLGSELMLERFREFAWAAELSDLAPRGSWKGDHTTLLKRAGELARAKSEAYTYELADHRREAIDALIARANAEFAR